jgi:hypothetical protein
LQIKEPSAKFSLRIKESKKTPKTILTPTLRVTNGGNGWREPELKPF